MKLKDIAEADDDTLIEEWNLFIASYFPAVPRTIIISIIWISMYLLVIRGWVIWLLNLTGLLDDELLIKFSSTLSGYIGFDFHIIQAWTDLVFVFFTLKIFWSIYYPMFKEQDLKLAERRKQRDN